MLLFWNEMSYWYLAALMINIIIWSQKAFWLIPFLIILEEYNPLGRTDENGISHIQYTNNYGYRKYDVLFYYLLKLSAGAFVCAFCARSFATVAYHKIFCYILIIFPCRFSFHFPRQIPQMISIGLIMTYIKNSATHFMRFSIKSVLYYKLCIHAIQYILSYCMVQYMFIRVQYMYVFVCTGTLVHTYRIQYMYV